jgi:predicted transposase YdaD
MGRKKNSNAAPHQAHNNFLEKILVEHKTLQSFVQQNLPAEILEDVDLDSIVPTNSHYVSENLRKYMSDLLVKMKKKGEETYIYCLIEHKARAEKLTALQVTIYLFQAMLTHADLSKDKPLPMIYPIILHNGRKKFSYPTNVWDLVNGSIKDIRRFNEEGSYLLDLPSVPDEALLTMPYFPVTFPELLLKHIFDNDILEWFKKDPRVLELFAKYAQAVGQNITIAALQYAHARAKISDVREFARAVSVVDKVFEEEIMTAEQAAINQGVGIGARQQRTLIVSRMLAIGEPIEKIAMVSGLSIEEINQLAPVQPEFISN